MKTILIAAVAFALTAPMAMATDNGGKPSDRELAERRCGNNGEGNDAELLFKKKTKDGIVYVCKKFVDLKGEPDEDIPRDVDPN